MDNNLEYATNLKDDLYEALEAIDTPGSFAAWGALPTTPPAGLHVDEVGDIALPLSEHQARLLIAKAHQAPYGRRSETLIDLSVRMTWEINADQLHFYEPAWQGYLLELSKLVATSLGISGPIRLELYKMLIYEKGAMFKPHTDTERIPGMFGTLIICLPSAHTGGEVIARHNGKSMTLRTSDAAQSFACWYSDVTHEVLPVNSGYRCVLTYNLAIKPGLSQPAASALNLQIGPLRRTLQLWLKDLASRDATDVPTHLYHVLDHEYTQAAMSFKSLKAADFARVQALRDLASELPFEVFLALLEKKEDGPCEDNDSEGYSHYNKRCKYDDDFDDSEGDNSGHHFLVEVFETDYSVKSLRALDGTIVASNYDFDLDFCLVEDPFEDREIAKEAYEPYQGNWGPSATHWYRQSALVIVPHVKLEEYLNQCISKDSDGFNSAMGYLARVCSTPSAPENMLQALHTLCIKQPATKMSQSVIVDILKSALVHSHYELLRITAGRHKGHLQVSFFDWAKQWLNTLQDVDRTDKYARWIPLVIYGYPSTSGRLAAIREMSDPVGSAATLDPKLGDLSMWAQSMTRRCIESLLETTQPPVGPDGRAVVTAVMSFNDTWANTSALLSSIFNHFRQAPATAFCLDFLSGLKEKARSLAHADTLELYRKLSLSFFNEDRPFCDLVTAAKEKRSSATGLAVTPQALVHFACDLDDMSTAGGSLLEFFIQEISSQCTTFSAEDMQELWMPFLYQLIPVLVDRSVSLNKPCFQQLASRFIKQLDEKSLGPCPRADTNPRRPQVYCSCIDCKRLNRFLQDAHQRVGRFPLSKSRRQHLHQELDGAGIACTHITERIGSPETLVVTKKFKVQENSKEWKKRQKELYAALSKSIRLEHLRILLGDQRATHVQSLAGLEPAATAS